MSGKQKGDGLGEVCPYCGRKFKRLKSHLNHCKMAPALMSSKSLDSHKDVPLKATVVKSKKKAAATASQDKLAFSIQNNTEHLDFNTEHLDLKTKSRNRKNVKSSKENTSTPLATSQTTNPGSEGLSEDTAQLKRKWQGKKDADTDKLSNFLKEKGRKSSTKLPALGKITLAANVLKGKANKETNTEVQAAKPHTSFRSKDSLSLPAGESGHHAPLTAVTLLQDKAMQTHFQKDTNQSSSQHGRGQDLMCVRSEILNSSLSNTFKVDKTSVWEHINGGLLGQKYGGAISPSLDRTNPQVGNATSLTSASTISSHLSAMRSPNEGPLVKLPDSSRPPQANPIQGLLPSHSDSLSSETQSLEWMSSVTAGYHGMKVYRPPGRMAQGHEHFWTKPFPEPQPPTPLPATLVSEVLGGSKRPQGPSSSVNPGRQAYSPSIVPLAERRIGDVTLNELIPWLADRTPQSPRHGLTILKNGWQWYYKRYIDVRKGGIGGIGMLVAGYCFLSYVWSYPHLKHERWRKYH